MDSGPAPQVGDCRPKAHPGMTSQIISLDNQNHAEAFMKNTPFDLTGKVAVVTGSSRGIGRSSAELLARLGAKVVVSSRKADACEEVAAGIRKEGGDAFVIPCNISRRAEVDALIAGSVKHYGKIDILVCNAAVNPYF